MTLKNLTCSRIRRNRRISAFPCWPNFVYLYEKLLRECISNVTINLCTVRYIRRQRHLDYKREQHSRSRYPIDWKMRSYDRFQYWVILIDIFVRSIVWIIIGKKYFLYILEKSKKKPTLNENNLQRIFM